MFLHNEHVPISDFYTESKNGIFFPPSQPNFQEQKTVSFLKNSWNFISYKII